MAEPQLLVDQAEGFMNGGTLLDGHLDVRKCQELEYLVVVTPYPAKFVLRPASPCRGDDLALARTFAGPTARLEILLENVDWRAVVALVII